MGTQIVFTEYALPASWSPVMPAQATPPVAGVLVSPVTPLRTRGEVCPQHGVTSVLTMQQRIAGRSGNALLERTAVRLALAVRGGVDATDPKFDETTHPGTRAPRPPV